MGFLPKGGINVAGHKIPWEAIGAVAALAGVVLVIRGRQGSNVASVGQAPSSSALDPSLGSFGSSTGSDAAALANLESQLTTLQQSITTTSSTSTLYGLVDTANANALVPLASTLGGKPSAWVQQGTQVSLVGSPQAFNWGGKSYLGQEVNVGGTDYWVNALNLPTNAI